MRLKTYARSEDRSWWKPFEVGTLDLVRDDPLALQMDHLCDVIQGLAQPRVTARDGLNNLRVTEAISQAAQTSRLVEIMD
jgi:predicted dehydrogenase